MHAYTSITIHNTIQQCESVCLVKLQMLSCPSYFQMTRWKCQKCCFNKGCQSGREVLGLNPPPLNFGGGSRGWGVELPLILRDFFLIDHIIMLLCTGYFYKGGGELAPLKLTQPYSLCIFIYIGNLKSGLFIT